MCQIFCGFSQQEHTTKLTDSSTLSSQVPGYPEVAQELPSQPPVLFLFKPWINGILIGINLLIAYHIMQHLEQYINMGSV